MITLQEKLMRGFFNNIGGGLKGFWSNTTYKSSTNTFWAEKWEKMYQFEFKDNYLYIYKNDVSDRPWSIITPKVHIIRFDLTKGLFWQAVMQNCDPINISWRMEPTGGGFDIIMWDKSITNKWGKCITHIVLHDKTFGLYEAGIYDPDGTMGLDIEDFLSKGCCNGGFGARNAVQNKEMLNKYLAYEKIK